MADGGEDFNLGHVVGSQGAKGDKGDTGATGNGIQSIVLRSTVGKVKTYRITFTNGDTFDFQVTDGEDGSSSEVEIVTSWNSTLSDEKVPSEKLSKNTLDAKAPTSHASSSSTYGLGSTSNYGHVKTVNGLTQSSHSNGTALSAYQGKVLKDAIDAKPDSSDIPTKTSDLTNDSNYISTSSTSGLIKNDGTIDTNTYLTQMKVGSTANYIVYTTTNGVLASKEKLGNINYLGRIGSTANKPLITTTNGTITTGSFGTTANSFCEGNDSRLSDARTPTAHTHTVSNITDFPTIPSSSSDLSDGSDLVKKSSTTGLIKNDGTIMTSGTGSTNYAVGNHTHSGYVSATKVTSWQSTPSDSNVPSEKLVSDTFDAIEDLIGEAIQYINQ